MDLSPQGAAFVRAHEGFVPRYYLDPVGIGTIGIGFTWASEAFREWWGKNKRGMKFGPGATMTRDEAEDALIYLFRHEYGKAVNDFLGRAVAQHVFDGMASPVYNLGPGSLKWKWAAAAKAGDYARAAELLRKTGTTGRGSNKPLPGLVRRRAEEALLLEKGIYTGIAPVPVDALSDGMLIRGERGPAVKALINDLAELGFYDGIRDDVFGPGTEAAVMAFQRAKGLAPDGYAGPQTLAAIEAARSTSKKPNASPEPPVKTVTPIPSPPDKDKPSKSGLGGFILAILALAGVIGTFVAELPCSWFGILCQ